MMLLAQEVIEAPKQDYMMLLPELVLMGTGLLILLMIAIHRFANTAWYALLAFLGAAGSAAAGIVLWREVSGGDARLGWEGMISADGFSTFLVLLVSIALALGILLTENYLEREGIAKAEYYVLMLFSASGMQFMAMSNNLIMLFLALEVLSVCLYVLAAFNRDRLRSQEAGMKYLLLGAYSSAIFVYGIALIYGGVGTTNFSGIAQFFAENVLRDQGMVVLGMALLIVGLAFKIAAVPFHMWTPDVYEGAPTPAVAFMASGAKIAGFAGLFRVLETALASMRLDWEPILWVLAVLTMLVGSVIAIVQTNVKRILAYSSIATAGFVLIGVVAGNERGMQGSLFYLFVYTFMIMGAFAVVALVARRGEQYTSLDDYKGLFKREPMLAGCLTFFLFAMAGIPGTSGFVAKFTVFTGAAVDKQWPLVVIGTVASVVSLALYLRVIVAMYMDEPVVHEGEVDVGAGGDLLVHRIRVPATAVLALTVTVAATIYFGIFPQGLLNFAGSATLFFG